MASAIQAALCDCAGQRIRALLTTQADMVTALYPHNEWKEKALPAAEGRRAFLDRHLKGNKENHKLIDPKTKALIEAIDKVMPLCKVFQCTSIIEDIKQIDLDARAYVSACGAITISVYQYEKLGSKYSKADLKKDAEKLVKGLQKHKPVFPDEILVEFADRVGLDSSLLVGPAAKKPKGAEFVSISGGGEGLASASGAASFPHDAPPGGASVAAPPSAGAGPGPSAGADPGAAGNANAD